MRAFCLSLQMATTAQPPTQLHLRKAIFAHNATNLLRVSSQASNLPWFAKYRPLFDLTSQLESNE